MPNTAFPGIRRLIKGIAVCLPVLFGAASAWGAVEQGDGASRNAVAALSTVAGPFGLTEGAWSEPVQRVIHRTDGDAIVTGEVLELRSPKGLVAVMLVQTPLLAGTTGWGPPNACLDSTVTFRVEAYHSLRDSACAWAKPVAQAGATGSPRLSPKLSAETSAALASALAEWKKDTDGLMWAGARVSNRRDFLDIQLLFPPRPVEREKEVQDWLVGVTRSLSASWSNVEIAEDKFRFLPIPVEQPPAASSSSDILSTGALKLVTYRTALSIKTFGLGMFTTADPAKAAAIMVALNVLGSSIFLVNDYLWESWSPLAAPSQDFLLLMEPG